MTVKPPPCFEDIIELALPDGSLMPSDDTDVYTAKLGGKPVWLNPPTAELVSSLKCKKCQTDLFLLLQIECPREEYPGVERIAYVFVCNTRVCSQDQRGWRVIFMMKPRSSTDDDKSEKEHKGKTSFWDSLMNESEVETTIGGGKSVAAIKESATTTTSTTPAPATIKYECKNKFPGIYLHIDEEIIIEKREKVVPSYSSDGPVGTEEEWSGEQYEKIRVPGIDKSFSRFQKRIAHYPRQCVRYIVSSSSAGDGKSAPLLFRDCDLSVELKKSTTSCASNPSYFEMQLMPAILSFIPTESEEFIKHISKDKRSKNPIISDGMEWGTVLIYSCGSACFENEAQISEGSVIIQLE